MINGDLLGIKYKKITVCVTGTGDATIDLSSITGTIILTYIIGFANSIGNDHVKAIIPYNNLGDTSNVMHKIRVITDNNADTHVDVMVLYI